MVILFNMNKKMIIKQLFYDFYYELLELYTKKNPKGGISMDRSFKTLENGHEVSGSPKIGLHSCSYYFENKNDIQALPSFKKIIEFIKKSPNILKSDDVCSGSPNKNNIGKKMYKVSGIENSYGATIYSIARDIYENYNKTSIQIKWDFEAIEKRLVNINEDIIHFKLNNKSRPLPTDRYYYYLQNLKLKKGFKLELGSDNIEFKKLTDKEKTQMINSNHFGSEDFTVDISSIDAAIISKKLLDEERLKHILSLLRIFKAGNFRIYGIGELKRELNNILSIRVNTFANVVEKPLNSKGVFFSGAYTLNNNEIKDFKKLFKLSYPEIKSFEFASECISILHSMDDKYKIPIIFYILESFFPKINTENTYRLSYCISKILKKPYSFYETIKHFYTLRSKIVHGSNQSKLNTTFKKIMNKDGKPCNNIKESLTILETIMRNVWKEILIKKLHTKKDIEGELF